MNSSKYYEQIYLTEYELMTSREIISTMIENANVKKVCFKSRKSHEMERNWDKKNLHLYLIHGKIVDELDNNVT